ncbi:MAG TPA: bifunctional 5,10-methylenetetrahydrofolate dehydrogenase/5,10-methenyltetrahydrofolate cyclohydrolase [Candidatus Dojkabacteria bacterium]|nr:bifunctional 5,10-methylenetetrahydrofolate dehydrogenase/5,10-methenyltetrahydrofolate cyclohydrolase [Candidatus Dojkabacteria bacterium]
MEIINGAEMSAKILAQIKDKLASSADKPKLEIVFIGNNSASQVYVAKKKEAGEACGIEVNVTHRLEATTQEVKDIILKAAQDDSVNGIILQLPAPNIDLEQVLPLIPLHKDVDGLNPLTLGRLWHNNIELIPATVKAIIKVMEYIATKQGLELQPFLSGKRVLIINRSLIIGKPLAALLINYDATVSIAHSKSGNLNEMVRISDIVISGTGQQGIFDIRECKKDTILIDAGFSRQGDKVYGDIDLDADLNVSYLSPVPNGIGPIGVACLLENTLQTFLDQSKL